MTLLVTSQTYFQPRLSNRRSIRVKWAVPNMRQLISQFQMKRCSSYSSYGNGVFDDEVDWSKHPCKRECQDGAAPMTCRYGFTIENYSTMSKACYDCPFNVTDCFRPHCLPGDGSNTRMVLVVNRLLPGPTIEVCKGDRIIVDMTNRLIGQSTTLHWHGSMAALLSMDGTPMVSQCPIASGDSCRYEFRVDVAGSLFWHAHDGIQRPDGLFGALIVRKPSSENPVAHLYERDEHVIMLNDWTHFTGSESYVMQYHSGVPTHPHTIFVNGRGTEPPSSLVPRTVFRVQKGTRNRFRVINAAGHVCTLYIRVDEHPLLVVSTDGADVVPVEVDVIRLATGERYDFVLTADRQVDNYWIHVSGDVNCAPNKAHQQAILRYEGAPEIMPRGSTDYRVDFGPDVRLLNPFDRGSESAGAMCVSCSLTSLDDNDDLYRASDHQFYLAYDFHFLDNPVYHREGLYPYHRFEQGNEHDTRAQQSLQINGISYERPNVPLQTQSDLTSAHLCNVSEIECTRRHCSCPNVLQLELDSVVELVIVDEGIVNLFAEPQFRLDHPMHLHGFHFRVLAMEKIGETTTVGEVKARDRAGRIRRRRVGAPWKDVLSVLSGGYAVVRFRADNPGYWLFHCHFDKHMHNGMAMIFKVGEDRDFPPVPRDFPSCRNHVRSDFTSG